MTSLFTTWHWNAGKDQIDSGYDLCVGPDHATYKGARFMVQVKGTAKVKTKGSITAPVSKARLRQYAESVLPVFIVRVTADGGIYWIHAQDWAKRNNHRLAGSGDAGVKIDRTNDLTDRERFERYLAAAFASSPTHGKPLSGLEQKAAFLNSIDPNLGVRVRSTESGSSLALDPKNEVFEGKFSFQVVASPQNTANLNDALKFGLPREVETVNFRASGSPVFDHVIPSSPNKGKVMIKGESEERALVRLYPGSKRSVSSSVLAIEVESFRGNAGTAKTSERLDSLFDLKLTFEPKESDVEIRVAMGLRDKKLTSQPIRELDALRPLTDWVDQAVLQRAIRFEVGFGRDRLPMTTEGDQFEELLTMLDWFRATSRLHLIADYLSSDFVLPKEARLSGEELGEIDLAYMILKGDRCRIKFPEFATSREVPREKLLGKHLLCTTTIVASIQGHVLGRIPVAIELSGFDVQSLDETGGARLVRTQASEAWMFFDHEASTV